MKITAKQLKQIIKEQLEESQTLSKEVAMEKLQQVFPEFAEIYKSYRNYGGNGESNPMAMALEPLRIMAWDEFLKNRGLSNKQFSALISAIEGR